MYGFLWRLLPGPWLLKLLCVIALVAAFAWACVTWLYPWAATLLPGVDTPARAPNAAAGRLTPPGE